MNQPRFLIIQLRQVGDVLISTTVCETLKKNFPNSQVDYVVYPYSAPVAQNNPYIDHLLIVPNGFRSILTMLRTIFFMRRQKYDYVIDILNTPKSIWLARLAGAKKIIGQASDKLRTRHYDYQISFDKNFLADQPACKSVRNRLHLLTPISQQLTYVTRYKMYLQDKELAAAKTLLANAGVDFTQPVWFFAIGSRSPNSKQWPLDNFIQVINFCIEHYACQIILCPGNNETADAEYVRSQLVTPDKLFIFTQQNLRSLAAIISHCQLFVGNDSGPRHIAIAVDTPSIAIFSPTIWHYDWDPPNNPHHQAITIQSILQLSTADYEHLLLNLKPEQAKLLYQKITPDIVEQAVTAFYSQIKKSNTEK